MLNIEDSHKPDGKGLPPPLPLFKKVTALIDSIVFCQPYHDVEETVIKVWRNIAYVKNCFVEVINQDVYTCRVRGAWVVSIEYRLVIEYVSGCGFEHAVMKTVLFEKVIPFPLACPEDEHGMINFFDAKPHLYVEKVECKETMFDNIDFHAIIKVFVELKFTVTATLKKGYELLTTGPKC